ncbi:MAG: hypothetical protein ACI845_000473 [Gammaproteobacteria bacterium]|jgi:hypothetical protein
MGGRVTDNGDPFREALICRQDTARWGNENGYLLGEFRFFSDGLAAADS